MEAIRSHMTFIVILPPDHFHLTLKANKMQLWQSNAQSTQSPICLIYHATAISHVVISSKQMRYTAPSDTPHRTLHMWSLILFAFADGMLPQCQQFISASIIATDPQVSHGGLQFCTTLCRLFDCC